MTIEDLADRWDTPQMARTNGPAELGFREKEYMAKWNVPKPQYRDQGSEAFLKRLWGP